MQAAGDVLAKLSNVLPTGTFLAFQALAPLATNNGDCGVTEKVLTSIALVVLSALCVVSCFTDSYREPNRVLHPGFVTSRGLWNPTFKDPAFQAAHRNQDSYHLGLNQMYRRSNWDFVNAGVSVAALATLTLLTPPVTTCFYPHIAVRWRKPAKPPTKAPFS
ncbi:hypothetical protein CY35_04G021100 [Sphagnum magellanicum]|jgi:hypothetical protein|nr:hypothetical protein CY35_04G021100 [Sphagnum magellanicum]